MGRCEVYNLPVSMRPPPNSLPYARRTGPTTDFVWGVGVMNECFHSHSVPTEVENNRYSKVFLANDQLDGGLFHLRTDLSQCEDFLIYSNSSKGDHTAIDSGTKQMNLNGNTFSVSSLNQQLA